MDINEYKLLINKNEIVIIYIYSKSFSELNKKITKLKDIYNYIYFLDIIEHKGKEYFVIDNMVYRKKANGDKGKKVGKLVNGKIKFIKKK